MKTKKKYGQHFLTDLSVTQAIAEHIKSHADYKNVVEVGPGSGALTKHLIDAFENYIAIEIDDDVIPVLKSEVPALKKIVQGDFLSFDIEDTFDGEPFLLTGNYPYNISSQIIFKMLENASKIPVMVGMFQQEVAHRIISKPGSKVYGVISVLTQLEYDGSLVLDIGPEAFTPPPKVNSSVILLEKHDRYQKFTEKKLLYQVVKQSFGQRRKMMKNTLKSFFENKETLKGAIFEKRPEQLSVENFIELVNMIKKDKNEFGK